MFKLRSINLPNGYTSADLANALVSSIVYTFGDRTENNGFDIVAIPGEGQSETGNTLVAPVVIIDAPDATMLVTEYTSGKMGVIPFSTDEDTFVRANPTLMSDIAELLGYSDYVVYDRIAVGQGDHGRLCWTTNVCTWGQDTDIVAIARSLNANYDMYIPPSGSKAMFILTGGIGIAAPNGVVRQSTHVVRVPREYYFIDMQNVQDAARLAVNYNVIAADEANATLIAALAGVTELVGSLSVFGNTVKDVTTRYNAVAQYIPRP